MQQLQRGFTIIEMLVSMALFTTVVTISVATLLVLIDTNTRAQSQQILADNLANTLDIMTRQIRLGENYYCDSPNNITVTPGDDTTAIQSGRKNCLSGGAAALGFTDTRTGTRYAYARVNNHIVRKTDTGTWENMTSDDITIKRLIFNVEGTDGFPGDTTQPSVTIYIEAELNVAGESDLSSSMSLQTSVTQRKLDL